MLLPTTTTFCGLRNCAEFSAYWVKLPPVVTLTPAGPRASTNHILLSGHLVMYEGPIVVPLFPGTFGTTYSVKVLDVGLNLAILLALYSAVHKSLSGPTLIPVRPAIEVGVLHWLKVG